MGSRAETVVDSHYPHAAMPPDDTEIPVAPDAAYRLPRSVVPLTYRLTVEPDLQAATFAGAEEVELDVLEPVADIVCNAAELEVRDASVELADGTRLAARSSTDAGTERRDVLLRRRRPPRPGDVAMPVRRRAQRQAPGLLPEHVHRRRGRYPDDRHQPDGVLRHAAGVPLLGRARPQGGLRGDPRDRRRSGRLLEHEHRRADRRRGRSTTRPLRAHHEDVHVSRRAGGRAARSDAARRRRRRGGARGARAGQGAPHGLRSRGRRPRPAVLRRVLRHPLPRGQARSVGHPRFRLRGDGELRVRHVPGDRPARRRDDRRPGGARTDRGRRGARNRAHVVRRSRHDALVGGHLAQRGVRHADGDALRGRLPADVATLGQFR